MNPNTRLRLWKETRALLPTWAAMAALMALTLLFGSDGADFLFPLFCFGCALLGSVSIGHEFTHRTMGLLLAQPVSRRNLWAEKLLILGVALAALLLWMLLVACEVSVAFEPVKAELVESGGFEFLLIPLLLVLCTGPTLTLLARGSLGGVVLTLFCPFALASLGVLLFHLMRPTSVSGDLLFAVFQLAVCLYAGLLFLLGCRRFEGWEDSHGHRQELTLPAPLLVNFDRLSRWLTPGPASALGQLVRKELRLHLSAFVLAGAFVVGWLFLLVDRLTPPTALPKDIVMLPSVLLCHLIPVLVGIISTAEERNLGLHEWHLTLPVSTRKQWLVKLLVALGVNGLLGLLLPGVLAHTSSWLFKDPTLLEPNVTVFPYLPVANGVLFCAALYASTASANALRALLGTVGLFVAGGLVMNLGTWAANGLNAWTYWDWLNEVRAEGWPAPELVQWAYRHSAPLAWVGLVGWLGALGWANFRRTLGSTWQPMLRLVPFFAVSCLFAVVLFSYLSIFGTYLEQYYPEHDFYRDRERARQRAIINERSAATPTPLPPPTSPAKPRD